MDKETIFIPRMPEVDIRPEMGAIFARARAVAGQTKDGHRRVVIVTPGRLLIAKTCPDLDVFSVEQLALLGELVPPEPKVNIAVIAYTYLEALKADIHKAIPFFDFMLGFSALGHTVWIFEGHSSALPAGCAEADLLLVDSAMALEMDAGNPGWQEQAKSAMRGDTIRIIARAENEK